MLIGKSQEYGEVNLLNYQRQEIENFRQVNWFCLSCQEKLILKNGQVMLPHFAHYPASRCRSFAEGESEEHLAGKELLAQWCEKFQVDYQLEAYLPKLKQRPDLLIKDQLVIEFQCSPISLADLRRRTENYLAAGYQVVWLLGKSFFLKKQVTYLARNCLNYHAQLGFYYWELDVRQKEIRCLYYLEEVLGQKQTFYTKQSWGFLTDSPVKIFNYPEESLRGKHRTYETKAMLVNYFKQLEQQLQRRQGKILKLQGDFYQYGTHLLELSTIYFLPITRSLFSGEEIILWRWEVWQDVTMQKNVTLSQLQEKVLTRLQQQGVGEFVTAFIPTTLIVKQFLTSFLRELINWEYVTLNQNKLKILRQPAVIKTPALRQASLDYYLRETKHISMLPAENMLLW